MPKWKFLVLDGNPWLSLEGNHATIVRIGTGTLVFRESDSQNVMRITSNRPATKPATKCKVTGSFKTQLDGRKTMVVIVVFTSIARWLACVWQLQLAMLAMKTDFNDHCWCTARQAGNRSLDHPPVHLVYLSKMGPRVPTSYVLGKSFERPSISQL